MKYLVKKIKQNFKTANKLTFYFILFYFLENEEMKIKGKWTLEEVKIMKIKITL